MIMAREQRRKVLTTPNVFHATLPTGEFAEGRLDLSAQLQNAMPPSDSGSAFIRLVGTDTFAEIAHSSSFTSGCQRKPLEAR